MSIFGPYLIFPYFLPVLLNILFIFFTFYYFLSGRQPQPGRHLPASRYPSARQTLLAPARQTLPCQADTLPPPLATAVDGTHPTGMHSCFSLFFAYFAQDIIYIFHILLFSIIQVQNVSDLASLGQKILTLPFVLGSTHFRVVSICLSFSCLYLLPPANEVCEGYVFTGVCLSTGGGVCSIAWRDTPPWADTPQADTPPRLTPPGRHPLGRHPPCTQCMLGCGRRKGGRHPNGMHSCSYYFL